MSHALWRAMTADTIGSMQITGVLSIDSEKLVHSGRVSCLHGCISPSLTTANYSQFSV